MEPVIAVGPKTHQEMLRLITAYQVWDKAELPADAFAKHQQDAVLDSIARSLASQISGSRWASLETRLGHVDREYLVEYLDDMQEAVGIEPRHKALADKIARRLWQWKSDGDLVGGVFRNHRPDPPACWPGESSRRSTVPRIPGQPPRAGRDMGDR